MRIKVFYDDGTLDDFETTFLSIQDGFTVSNDSINLDVPHIEEHGLTLSRYAHVQDLEGLGGEGWPIRQSEVAANNLLVPRELIGRIALVLIDDVTALVRRADGSLVNVLLEQYSG